MTPVEGDVEFANGYLVEYDPAVGWERIANVAGRSPVGRAAVVIDSTAALGTPEVVYRRNHGESMADAADRLRAEVMQTAHNALSASIDTDAIAEVVRVVQNVPFVGPKQRRIAEAVKAHLLAREM